VNVAVEDERKSVLTPLFCNEFNGFFVDYDADFSFAEGYGCSMIRAGGSGVEMGDRGIPISLGCGKEVGLGAGISATGGTSTVMESSITDCGCDDK
jgi:hypothetical protein